MQPQDPRDPYTMPQQPGQPQGPLQPQMPGQQQQPQQFFPPLPPYQPPPNQNPQAPESNLGNTIQPAPAAPASPYDFFMQPKQSAPQRPLPLGGKLIGTRPGANTEGNFGRKKFIFIIAGALGLIAVLFMALVLLAPKDQTGPQFFSIAQTQQEVIRICNQGTKAKYQATRNFAITCSTTVADDQKELFAYMKKANLSYEPKLIGAKADSKTDSRLAQAASSSTYDETFRDVIKAQLNTYSRALTAQLSATTGVNGRETLNNSQKSVELLLLMVADDKDKTEAAAETP